MTERERRRVLVVDDDPLVLDLVAGSLEHFEVGAVDRAGGGEEAQRMLERQAYDVVVTDLGMPGLDGLALMRWSNEHRPGALWIVLSGLQAFDAAVEALQCGAFDFVPKPPRMDKLVLSVRNALERKRLERERNQLVEELRETSVELAQQVGALERQSARIHMDLERAQTIQRALLPNAPPESDRLRIDALYRPSRDLGGDLYDVVPLGADRFGLYVADATGHGVAAAMLSVLFKARLTLRDEAGEPLAPAAVLARASRSMSADVDAQGLFLTAVYALLDLRAGTVRIASAGHPPAYFRRADGLAQMLERTGPALGIEPDATYTEHRLEVSEGDRLLLFTDGLIEALPAARPDDPDPHYAQLRGVLSNALTEQEQTAGEVRLRTLFDGALARFQHLGQAEARDDVTLLLTEFKAGASTFDNREPEPGPSAEVTAASGPAVVWVGATEREQCFALRGRALWTTSDVFFRAAAAAVDAGRRVVVDLTDCEYLDSTFLGTIHELVLRGGDPDQVTLVGAGEELLALFEELGMGRVLAAHAGDEEPPAVELEPHVADSASVSRVSQERLLRAHELLSSLSESNRAQFAPVVSALRAELGEAD